ncbi:hypothetical protein I540_0622 [Mycobacteroides abscessus subsp. bolletii 1513]|uniref:Uncharacterized protein n=1 Tax=Mycobacteroides abscessus subsp. bolletii 1513 TaxID=1299321 RepID=X8E310_9MYCO|nr:hypothetical protein I540_0622 [Mycobacteroides abscessus subsp. bolletii 1513]
MLQQLVVNRQLDEYLDQELFPAPKPSPSVDLTPSNFAAHLRT